MTGSFADILNAQSRQALSEPARAALTAAPMPSRKDEFWKYNDLSWLKGSGLATKPLAGFRLETVAGKLIDRTLAPIHSSSPFSLLAETLGLRKSYQVVSENTILVLNLDSGAEAQGDGFAASSIDLQTTPHQRVVIVEKLGGATPQLGNLKISVAEGASVIHAKLTTGSGFKRGISHTKVQVAANASYVGAFFKDGNQLLRDEIDIELLQSGASCGLFSLALAKENQQADFHTSIAHLAPDTTSRQLAKGIYSGRARGIFRGRIKIAPKAQRSSAQQLSRSLLLSNEAEIGTTPELDIGADDVKATHGATVSQLLEQELFYLQSRAIDPLLARSMLLKGFGQEILREIGDAFAIENAKQWLDLNLVGH